jgi:DHA2 family multidrug resistance protein
MMLAPVGLFAILLSPIVGKNVQKFDPRKLATFSFVMFSVVLWMRSQFSTQADFMTIMMPTILQGIAVAFFFIPLSTLTLNGIAPAQMPSASGLSNFMRILGGSFGTSVTITLWQDRTAMHHAELSEMINRSSQATTSAISNFAAAGMSQEQGLASINRLIDQQAATMAADDIFLASALIFLLLIPIIWLAKPMQPPPQGVPSAKAPADAAGAH